MIEGDTNILNLSTETMINLDGKGDGFKDDQIHASAMEEVYNGYDYRSWWWTADKDK